MKKKVFLYWQETCTPAVYDVTKALRDLFPVDVVLAAAREPTCHAFDTARGQFDAFCLLRELPEPVISGDGGSIFGAFTLWLIEADISYAAHDYLYGAAWRHVAVVSAARIGFGENLLKEACHELGHLFGLEHCPNPCLMSASGSLQQLKDKPMSLCLGCASRL